MAVPRSDSRLTLGEGIPTRKDSALSIYEQNLDRNRAHYVPLSPVSFLMRAARIYGSRTAVIYAERRYTYPQFFERARRLASALAISR